MLKLAPNLKLPVDAVTQTFAIFGKRGSGKSNTATVLAEEMFSVAPFVVLTPLDNWWGLKASFDGKEKGLNVYVFGGDHGDLPLDPEAGELMARLFIEHRISMVLSMKGWSVGQRAKFVTAFALYLLGHNGQVPVHVFLEEADAFIPQRPYKGEEAMLGAMDRLVRWGRGEGIGATLITQRSAKVNKDVTTQCETLIAHRTIGPQDRDAIDAWIKYHGDQDKRAEVLAGISHLRDGQAYVWSPEWLGILDLFQIRRRRTFDSASTPKVGEKRVEPKHLAPVDLEKLRGQLAKTIEQAKESDPKELRKQLAQLRKELAGRSPQVVEKIVEKRIEVPYLPLDLVREYLRRISAALVIEQERILKDAVNEAARVLRDRGARLAQTVTKPTTEQPVVNRRVDRKPLPVRGSQTAHDGALRAEDESVSVTGPHDSSNHAGLSGPQRRIIDSIAWLFSIGIDQPSRAQVAFISRMKPTAGHFNNLLGSLRTKELVDYPVQGRVVLTHAGKHHASFPDDPLTEKELQENILSVLNGPQRRIIEAVIPLGSEGISRADLASTVGMNHEAGHFNNLLGSLRTLGLIDYPARGWVRPTEILYLEI